MITRIKINGFKSFNEFEIEFTPLTIIAGSNASGKSNLFDALKLLSHLADSDSVKKAFTKQRGDFLELFTKYENDEHATVMNFSVEMLLNKSVKDAWGSTAELKYTRLRYSLTLERFQNEFGIEDIGVRHEELVNLKTKEDKWIDRVLPKKNNHDALRPKVYGRRGVPYITTVEDQGIPTVEVPQDGSAGRKRSFPLKNASRTVLSSFDTVDFPHVLAAKEEMKSWQFLQLNPEDLREPTDKTQGGDLITRSGKNLAGALYRISNSKSYVLNEISRKLNSFLPDFVEVNVKDDAANKQYLIQLKNKHNKLYSSRVLSEGTLRLLALCVLEHDPYFSGLLCFEEPENGIHPFRISNIAELLKDLSSDLSDDCTPLRQVIVNTHSSILVRYIFNWNADPTVSIYYSELVNRVTDVAVSRELLSVTRMTPVRKELDYQLSIPYSHEVQKMTLSLVQRYLENPETAE